MKRLAVACISFLAAGFAQSFNADEDIARTELLKIAPLGSDARAALPKLESMGFKCTWQNQKAFAGVDGKIDYLYCDQNKTVGFLVSRRWQLALMHQNYAVTNAKFGISLTGL